MNEGYKSAYTGPAPFDLQCSLLRRSLGIETAFDPSALDLPLVERMEGNFAVPVWQEFAPTYAAAVKLAVEAVRRSRPELAFYDLLDGKFEPENLRLNARSCDQFALLRAQQKNPKVLAVQAQFGLAYHGLSAYLASEKFGPTEFGPGSFAGLCMLLAHPDRLRYTEDLSITFTGDEYDGQSVGVFQRVTMICIHGGLCYRTTPDDHGHARSAPISACVPQR